MYIIINDIRYVNNELKSKIGKKYEDKRNKIYKCIPLPDAPSKYGLDFIEVDKYGEPTGFKFETTPFIEAAANVGGYDVCIITKNSIYDCTDVTREIEIAMFDKFVQDMRDEFDNEEER